MKKLFNAKYLPVLATLFVLALIFVFGALRYGDQGFTSTYNIVSLFRGGAVVGIAAIGSTFIILAGGIDLSVGAVIAFTSMLVATLISPELGPGWHPAVAIAVALAAGTLFGLMQGCLIHFFDLPPFLITLAGMFLARGLAFVVHSESVGISHPFYTQLRSISFKLSIPGMGSATVPFTVIVLLVCYALAIFAAKYLAFGREVYAVGGDEESAKLMGVNIGRVKIGIYTLGGFTAAIAGVIATAGMYSGNPKGFEGYELDAIAAVVIGGTLLTGGSGYVIGTLMGVLILGLIRMVIDNEGTLSTWWTNISAGLLLFLFILLQTVMVRSGKRGET